MSNIAQIENTKLLSLYIKYYSVIKCYTFCLFLVTLCRVKFYMVAIVKSAGNSCRCNVASLSPLMPPYEHWRGNLQPDKLGATVDPNRDSTVSP